MILNVQRQLARQNQQLCQRAEANGRVKAKRDSQLLGPWEPVDKTAKKQRHEREKVSGLQEAMGEVRREIGDVSIQSGETEEAVERGSGTRGDEGSYVSGQIRCRSTAGTDGPRIEEVLAEVAGLKAQLSDCCPNVKMDLTNLQRGLAKPKGEIRAMRLKAVLLAPPMAGAAVCLPRRWMPRAEVRQKPTTPKMWLHHG
jgi:hypothetical protein